MDALARDIREDILPDYIGKLTEIVNNLNTKNATNSDLTTCTICLESITKDNIVVELECGHIFHKHCIVTNIFNGNNQCPLCRKKFFNIPRIDTTTVEYITNPINNTNLTTLVAMLQPEEETSVNPLNNTYYQNLFRY